MPTATLEADAVLSDAVLQAARQIVSSHPFPVDQWAGCGSKNPPLLTLLDQLIGAMEPVAAAIADNAWDDSLPVPADGAKRLADALHRVADAISTAAAAPDRNEWSLPSMTGKELV